MKQAEHVPGDRVQPLAAGERALDIRDEVFKRGGRRNDRRRLPEHLPIHCEQPPRLAIGRATHHHAVDAVEVAGGLADFGDATIDDDLQIRMRGFEPVDASIIERRHLAIFLGR
jgi:hypothetical protein